ncbi:transcription factor IBH1-like 1 [Salvia divinorum]|uniref:Transcription factor IBH1-like 1 n=1 Tax=Salvia divinorum TaxID=28513 RepID=A0ABD1I465_SALDI
MKARMQMSSSVVKQEFFKKWIKGMQIYSAFNKEMTIMERKRAIKLSADVAIASTRSATTQWSRAVVADVSTSAAGAARAAAEEILGRKLPERKALATTCSKKIVRRSHQRRSKAAARGVVRSSAAIAKKLVRNRTRVLKRLVPGGKKLDEISLIKETLDYIACLQVQVDVMRHLAAAAESLDHQQISF